MAIGNADGQSNHNLQECASQDELEHVAAVGAQGHANADLTGTALDSISRDAVKSDGSEDEREDPKESGQLRDGALLIEILIHYLLHGCDFGESQVGIDVAENVADLGFQTFDVAMHLENYVLDVVAGVVQILHHGIVIVHTLREWREEQRAPPVSGGIGVVGLFGDADNLVGGAVLRKIEAEVGADGIFSGLKEPSDEDFIHDRDVAS